jgi:cell division protein FtsL
MAKKSEKDLLNEIEDLKKELAKKETTNTELKGQVEDLNVQVRELESAGDAALVKKNKELTLEVQDLKKALRTAGVTIKETKNLKKVISSSQIKTSRG